MEIQNVSYRYEYPTFEPLKQWHVALKDRYEESKTQAILSSIFAYPLLGAYGILGSMFYARKVDFNINEEPGEVKKVIIISDHITNYIEDKTLPVMRSLTNESVEIEICHVRNMKNTNLKSNETAVILARSCIIPYYFDRADAPFYEVCELLGENKRVRGVLFNIVPNYKRVPGKYDTLEEDRFSKVVDHYHVMDLGDKETLREILNEIDVPLKETILKVENTVGIISLFDTRGEGSTERSFLRISLFLVVAYVTKRVFFKQKKPS